METKKCLKCSAIKSISSFSIKKKTTKSLIKKEYISATCKECDNLTRRNSYIKNPALGMLANAKQRAKKFNIPINITLEDIIIPEKCPLLGIILERGTANNYENSPTIDRKNPELGYIKGNIGVISQKANWIKSNIQKEHYISFCNNIINYLNNDIVYTATIT